MMLCDDIVFWERHNSLPAFTNDWEMVVYEFGVSAAHVVNAMRQMLALTPAVTESFQNLAKAMQKIQRLNK